MKLKGIFVGLSTIDIIYRVSESPAPNRKIAAQSQEIFVGGPATNAAITFAFLGGSAKLVTPAGRHPLASVIKEGCEHFGIELIDLVPDSHEGPPVSSIWVDAEGQRSVVSANAKGRVIPAAIVDPSRMAGVNIVLVDGHPMQACQAWADAASSADTCVVMDGGSWKPGTDQLLRSVDVAICSADFSPPGCTDERDVVSYLRSAGVTKIAITHGAAPIHFASRS